MNRTLRCRINERFPLDLLKALNKVCTDKTIPDNNAKIDMVKELLTRFNVDFSSLGPGTNRYAVLIDGVVFKIALDKWGQRDNLNEFVMAKELQPYVIKVYEVNSNGLIMTCEYVTVIDKDEYAAQRESILTILEDLSQSYLLGDVGYISKNFLNWGYNDAGELVILDFAYIYKIIAHEMKCDSPNCSRPFLEYNSTYSSLICPDCRRSYSFMDIRRKYSIKDEERYVKLTKELSYKTDEKTLVIETDEPEVIYNNPAVDDYDDDEFDYSNLTYSEIREKLEEKELEKDDDEEDITEILKEPYYQVSIGEENIFKYETMQSFKEEKTMSEFMKQLARMYQESAKRENKSLKDNPYKRYIEEDTKEEEVIEEESTLEEIDPYEALIRETNKQRAEQNKKSVEEKPYKKNEPKRNDQNVATRKEQRHNNPNNNNQGNHAQKYQQPSRDEKKDEVKTEASKPINNIPMRKPDEVIKAPKITVETHEEKVVVHEPQEEVTNVIIEVEDKPESASIMSVFKTEDVQETIETVSKEVTQEFVSVDIGKGSDDQGITIVTPKTEEEVNTDAEARGREIVDEILDAIVEEETMQNTEESKNETTVVSRNNPTGVIRKEKHVEFSFRPAAKKSEEDTGETEMEKLIKQQQSRVK